MVTTWRRPVRAAVGWTVVGVFLGINNWQIEQRVAQSPRGLGYCLADGLLFGWTWFVVAAGIVLLCRRRPFGRGPFVLNALLYVAAGLVAAVTQLALYLPLTALANRWLGSGPSGGGAALHWGQAESLMPWNLFTYGIVCVVVSAFEYHQRLNESEANAVRLTAQLSDARARTLEAQLQPHFLFNALHSIMVLMHRDVDAASAMLARLSDILRHALASSSTQESPLGDELAFALGYLEIERVRFHDRLTIEVDVDPAVRSAHVPRLLLQPLVENAIRHGIAKSAGPGRVSVRASASNGRLSITIDDTGPGPLDNGASPNGVGLSATRERLRLLYGSEATIDITRNDGTGTSVRLSLPLRLGALPANEMPSV